MDTVSSSISEHLEPDVLPAGWQCVHAIVTEPRLAELVSPAGLPLAPAAREYLEREFPRGIYSHQRAAIEKVLSGQHVCLATSTASGKTLAFTTAAIHHLASSASARVLAIYPQRSLGNEQERRWKRALESAGLGTPVGRIDGSVPVSTRPDLLRRSRVLVATTDVLHAWFLANLGNSSVRAFTSGLALVVVDEVHTYTGVVGSNASYLFRRLQHAARLLGGSPQFFAASATIRDPQRHLELLFGLDVDLVGPELDTSPRQRIAIHLAVPPRQADFLTEVTAYLRFLVEQTDHRFIAFVDSRKQTEHIASILGRRDDLAGSEDNDQDSHGDSAAMEAGSNIAQSVGTMVDPLEQAAVVPYRSGYEERDRQLIEQRLADGSLRGVISTSALELGIDIPHLSAAVLIGVPRSSTSMQQRIGRIGRAGPGTVVVINSGEIFDEAVYRTPEHLLERPPAEGALYLENRYIQYIHALCLARQGGEHDQVANGAAVGDEDLPTSVRWPNGFLEVCRDERTGQIPPELQSMKAESGDNPNLVFPLRDVESQFKVELRAGPNRQPLGQISFGQLLREAYPGAVYLYAMKRYRVTNVSLRERIVTVRPERWYSTRPSKLPTMVFPNLTAGNIFKGIEHGALRVLEANEQIREALCGYRERRGNSESTVQYPLTGKVPGAYFNASRFTRNYFTTGALLTHPIFDAEPARTDTYASLLYEALLMTAPYERQDLGHAVDKVRVQGGPLDHGRRFVTIFDQTYGSLRLSGRLLEPGILPSVAQSAVDLAEHDDSGRVDEQTLAIARALREATEHEPTKFTVSATGDVDTSSERLLVILPGSRGINLTNGNTEFAVERVVVVPRLGGLAYRGRHDTTVTVQGQSENVPYHALQPIPGESQMGYYNFETGEVEPL